SRRITDPTIHVVFSLQAQFAVQSGRPQGQPATQPPCARHPSMPTMRNLTLTNTSSPLAHTGVTLQPCPADPSATCPGSHGLGIAGIAVADSSARPGIRTDVAARPVGGRRIG